MTDLSMEYAVATPDLTMRLEVRGADADRAFLSIYQDREQGPTAIYLSSLQSIIHLQQAIEALLEQATAYLPPEEKG
jgi:hypothetical protein